MTAENAIPAVSYPHIAVNPKVRAGRPTIAGHRITVEDVVILRYRLGQSINEISATYGLPLAAVHSAMAYYYDHKPEIDKRIEEDDQYVEAMRRQNPSKLQEKLRTLRGE